MAHSLPFTADETAMLSDAQFFLKKARITEKIRGQLNAAHVVLKTELSLTKLITPSGFDPTCVQFVKGEHLESFPYQYLDCPKYFHGTEKCTFRTLFWWGHHAAFALIVEGPLVKQYRKNLFNRFSEVADRDLCLSLSPSLWEWKAGAGLTMEITHERRSELAAVLDHRTAFKIARYIAFDYPVLESETLIQEGIRTFRSILPIVTP